MKMEKNFPKDFTGERQKSFKLEKPARFQPAARQNFAEEGQKSIP